MGGARVATSTANVTGAVAALMVGRLEDDSSGAEATTALGAATTAAGAAEIIGGAAVMVPGVENAGEARVAKTLHSSADRRSNNDT